MSAAWNRLKRSPLAAAAILFLLLTVGMVGGFASLRACEGRQMPAATAEFRQFVQSLHRASLRTDVLQTIANSRHLRTPSNDARFIYVIVRHGVTEPEGWDSFARLRYAPDGRLFHVESGHASAGTPLDGIPARQCLVPPDECESLLATSATDPTRQ